MRKANHRRTVWRQNIQHSVVAELIRKIYFPYQLVDNRILDYCWGLCLNAIGNFKAVCAEERLAALFAFDPVDDLNQARPPGREQSRTLQVSAFGWAGDAGEAV
ncbi:MAG: hypothetical protein WCG92_23330 [Hyphomicrobiales bacterium]